MNSPAITVHDRALLERIRAAIEEVEPAARVILYGSRARGNATAESDWDLLIVLDGAVDGGRERAVRDRLLALSLETGAMMSPLVVGREDWHSPRSRASPLHDNVDAEGIELTGPGAGEAPAPPAFHCDTPSEERAVAEAREDIIREWLQRARRTLGAAELLAQGGAWNDCVNRLYYACFDAVKALLFRHGYRFSKHSSVQELFNLHFVRTGIVPPDLARLYNHLFESRLEADYREFVLFEEAQVRPWIAQTRRFITFIEALLAPSAPERGDV